MWGAKRCGEDKAVCDAADDIYQCLGPGHIAADHAETLCQRAFDERQAVSDAFAFSNAATLWSVEADSVHLVEVGQSPVSFCKVTNLSDRRDISVHAVDALEGDQLWSVRICSGEKFLEVGNVVVAEDPLLRAGAPDAFDHRIMVLSV